MLVKTKGIVLRYIKHRETSVIINIYTEALGLRTCIVNGVRSAKSKSGPGHFQPLSLLDLEIYSRKSGDIHRLAHYERAERLDPLYMDIRKATVAMFISEILYKSLREPEPNSGLFSFIYHSISILNTLEKEVEDFHLKFLLRMLGYLGFGIDKDHQTLFPVVDEGLLEALLKRPYDYSMQLTGEKRRQLLDDLVLYYKQYIDGLGEIKSLKVLREVFSF